MSIFYPAGVTSDDFDEPNDWLADKPKGFCPWCSRELVTTSIEEDEETPLTDDHVFCTCDYWEFWDGEESNRARYASQRESDARADQLMDEGARKAGREW